MFLSDNKETNFISNYHKDKKYRETKSLFPLLKITYKKSSTVSTDDNIVEVDKENIVIYNSKKEETIKFNDNTEPIYNRVFFWGVLLLVSILLTIFVSYIFLFQVFIILIIFGYLLLNRLLVY
ncbi:MAG: hypothetical protein WBA74_17315 [Cyclobacteriaceae bacterium]